MRIRKFFGLAVLALLGLAGVWVATNWAPDRPVASLKARWAPAPSQFVPIAGMDVHLRDEGPRDDPLPIVLVHGTSASLHTWDGWVEALAGQHRVIRVDLPGFGLTGPSPDGDYSLPAYARFIVQVMDQLGVQQAVLAGNSLGGAVAWKTAVDHPARVGKLVLVDAAGYPMAAQSIPLGFRLASMPALAPLLRNVLPRGLVASSVRNVYADPDKVTPALIDRYLELSLREGNREALRARLQAGNEAFTAQIAQIRQPTLVLWGAQDRLIPPSQAQHFARDIQGSQVQVFEGLGHVPHEEDPARTVAAVQAFLGQ
ncbi:MAG: alpha/beta fold hydrolase [Hydrogenophaga sp.]|uniref:alpha/beta fold hydrolase n=1 Tax=Hydrogenophaga sp. TaxID=1904254 RepID=UPI0026134E2D|nr:alpha/beta fold hydrolase [Hydrogenophaga sp.]MDM7942080.1 alpha/beta fold hydrolase [Hydrogenophaga sp.]